MSEVHTASRKAVLYISYDGMLEPLGQSQVIAYLERLAGERRIHLLSFEKPDYWRDVPARNAARARLREAGIRWHPRRYHKRPSALATAYDIAAGIVSGAWIGLRHRIGIVHARSDVPAAMALCLRHLRRARFVFDMRGFWADERVDGGLWPADGPMYRVAKALERRFLLAADHVVSLTRAGVREMQRFPFLQVRFPAVSVIPTCANLSRFRPAASKANGLVIGYVGSAGTWYLFDEVVACFAELLRMRPDARFLVLNRGEHAFILERLARGGVPAELVQLVAADHADVPAWMGRMHAAVFFIKPVFSKQASAPTKLAELLGCGIPCLVNAGIGDMQEVVEGEGVGIALREFDAGSLRDGLQRLLALVQSPWIAERCRDAAQRHFSLDAGVEAYRAIYAGLDQ